MDTVLLTITAVLAIVIERNSVLTARSICYSKIMPGVQGPRIVI